MNLRTSGDVKKAIAALIGDKLGTFSNGMKAIWVEPPLIPESLSPKGLKCVIRGIAQGTPKPTSAGGTFLDRYWTVFLVNYDRDSQEGAANFEDAKDTIERAFVHKLPPVYVAPTSTSYEQIRFSLYAPIVVSGV